METENDWEVPLEEWTLVMGRPGSAASSPKLHLHDPAIDHARCMNGVASKPEWEVRPATEQELTRAAEKPYQTATCGHCRTVVARAATFEEVELEGGIYAYTTEAYRRLGSAGGPEANWVKVGKASRNMTDRVRAQTATASAEPLVHLRQWVAPDGMEPAELERRVHRLLDLAGRRLNRGGGTEWFNVDLDVLAGFVTEVIGNYLTDREASDDTDG